MSDGLNLISLGDDDSLSTMEAWLNNPRTRHGFNTCTKTKEFIVGFVVIGIRSSCNDILLLLRCSWILLNFFFSFMNLIINNWRIVFCTTHCNN